MRIVKIFIWTEWAGAGQGLRLGEVWRMKCLVTGEDSIALGPNKLVYTFLVAQFLMSTGKPETHPGHTHPSHTHWHTHKHLLAGLFVLMLSFVWAADISLSQHSALALPLPGRTQFPFFLLLGLCNFPFSFLVLLSFIFVFFLSSRFLYFLCCCHCTLRQLLWRLSTKICSNFSCLAWPRFALPNTRVSSSSKPLEKLMEQ